MLNRVGARMHVRNTNTQTTDLERVCLEKESKNTTHSTVMVIND